MAAQGKTDAIKKWFDDITHNPIFWVVFSIIVAVSLRMIANSYNADERVSFLIALAGAIITLNVGNLYRNREITNHLSNIETSLEELAQKSERHYKL